MDYPQLFIAYASAFEQAYVTNEWTEVAACFAEQAVYEVPFDVPLGGRFEGREAIVGYLEDILDRLDRRFVTRRPELLRLDVEGAATVRIRGRVTYSHPAVPDLVFVLDEVAQFEGEHIVRLVDDYDAENRARILSYIAQHKDVLGIEDGGVSAADATAVTPR